MGEFGWGVKADVFYVSSNTLHVDELQAFSDSSRTPPLHPCPQRSIFHYFYDNVRFLMVFPLNLLVVQQIDRRCKHKQTYYCKRNTQMAIIKGSVEFTYIYLGHNVKFI